MRVTTSPLKTFFAKPTLRAAPSHKGGVALISQEELAERVHMSRGHLSHIEAPNMVSSFSISILFDICEALEIQLKNRFTGSDFRSLRRAVQSSTLKTRKLSGKFDQSFRFCCAANLGRRGYTGDCELQRAFRAQPPSAALSVRWPLAFRPWCATASVAAQPRSGAWRRAARSKKTCGRGPQVFRTQALFTTKNDKRFML